MISADRLDFTHFDWVKYREYLCLPFRFITNELVYYFLHLYRQSSSLLSSKEGYQLNKEMSICFSQFRSVIKSGNDHVDFSHFKIILEHIFSFSFFMKIRTSPKKISSILIETH